MDEFMSLEDAAFFLKISMSSVRKHIKNGKLHAYKRNNSLWLVQDEVFFFILPHEDE